MSSSARWLAPLATLLAAPSVAAHGGGLGAPVETRIDLPAWAFWAVGASVVALSFVVVAAFLTREKDRDAGAAPARPVADGPAAGWGPFAGLAAWFLILANAFVPDNATGLASDWFWLGLWVGVPLVQYSLGDAWAHVNPFAALGRLADRLRGDRTAMRYPRRLGAWPAVALVLLFIGLEVAVPGAREPRLLAAFLTAYTALSFFGMVYFGSDAWLSRAEALTRYYRWWAAVSPRGPAGRWGAPGRWLGRMRLALAGDVAFTVAVLYGVNFDGLLTTRLGAQAVARTAAYVGPAASLLVLVLGFGVFLAAYHVSVWGVRRAALSLDPHPELARRLAPALLPIAVGYHAAHNLFYLVENLPRLATALTDPFGLGWRVAPFDALPTTWDPPVGAAPWLAAAQVVLIVVGHVVAVVVAHRLSFGAFPSRIQAVRGEVPLTLAMVFYTLVGLAILSQASAGAAA